MNNIKRVPFWVTPKELEQMNHVLVKFLDSKKDLDLENICAELSVAKTRFDNTRFEKGVLANVLGLDKTMIPIRLSAQEKERIVQLPLSSELLERLK